MGWGFRYMQAEGGEGGSVYLRLSTRTLDQPHRMMTPDLQKGITDGAYWLRQPGPNCDVVVAYTGAVAPEAIESIGLIGESRRDIGLLAITSADRLHAGWTTARRMRRDRRGLPHLSHIERMLAPLPRDCGIVTVIDGHPAALGWLGSVRGQRVEALGVEHFGQTGTIGDLYRHYGIDANAIIDAAESLTAGAPVRHRKMAVFFIEGAAVCGTGRSGTGGYFDKEQSGRNQNDLSSRPNRGVGRATGPWRSAVLSPRPGRTHRRTTRGKVPRLELHVLRSRIAISALAYRKIPW